MTKKKTPPAPPAPKAAASKKSPTPPGAGAAPKKPAAGPSPPTTVASSPPAKKKAAKKPAAEPPVQPPIPGIEPTEPTIEKPAEMKMELSAVAHVSGPGGHVQRIDVLLNGVLHAAVAFTERFPPADHVAEGPHPLPGEAVAAPPAQLFDPPPGAPPAGELDRLPAVELQVDVLGDTVAEIDDRIGQLAQGLGVEPASVNPPDDEHDYATAFFEYETLVDAQYGAAGARAAPFVRRAEAVDPAADRLSADELAQLDARPRTLAVSGEPRIYCSRCAAVGRAPAGLTPVAAMEGAECHHCGWPTPPPA